MAGPWLQLLRAPNLLTVPGDSIAGFLLNGGNIRGNGHGVTGAVLAGLAFYAGGLALNDWFDQEEDRRQRPWRPLPSGSIAARAALWFGVVALAMGCICATWAGGDTGAIGMGLAVAIVVYNVGAKRHAVAGPPLMGICRSMNVLLGVSAAGHPWSATALSAALMVGLYVVAVSFIAKRETEVGALGGKAWWPVVALLFGILLTAVTAARDRLFSRWPNEIGWFWMISASVMGVMALAAVMREAVRLRGATVPQAKGSAVGRWICALPLLQGALCALVGAEGVAIASPLVLGHVLCRWMGTKVNAS